MMRPRQTAFAVFDMRDRRVCWSGTCARELLAEQESTHDDNAPFMVAAALDRVYRADELTVNEQYQVCRVFDGAVAQIEPLTDARIAAYIASLAALGVRNDRIENAISNIAHAGRQDVIDRALADQDLIVTDDELTDPALAAMREAILRRLQKNRN